MNARRGVWAAIASAVLFVIAVALAFTLRNFVLFQLALAMSYAVAILGLNLLTGVNGQFSLGHSAFFALGAYVTAMLMGHAGVNYGIAIALGALVSLGAGWLFGLTATRLDGLYLALATFALAVATPPLLKLAPFERWTGGSQGLVVGKPGAPLSLPLNADQWLYLVCLVVLTLALTGACNLVTSPSGRALIAIRDNPTAAQTMGIDVARYRALVFAVSAFYAGLAGGLAAVVIGFVAPDSFTVTFAIALFVGLIVGGAGSMGGALIGGLFILFVPNVADGLSKGLAGLVYGAILLAFIYLLPSGAAGLGRAIVKKLARQ
jgi:branched-chain amino acid transport system permease protein